MSTVKALITKALIAATAAFGYAASACAQDSMSQDVMTQDAGVSGGTSYESPPETIDSSTVDIFEAADANADAALDREEFRVFVDTHASAGHEGAAAMAGSGDYDSGFTLLDTNADGRLDATELAALNTR